MVLADDPDYLLQYLWMQKTGSPPKAYDAYHPLVLQALLFRMSEELKRRQMFGVGVKTTRHRGIAGPPGTKTTYARAHVTGDSKVDEWEREIAMGRVPDLEK